MGILADLRYFGPSLGLGRGASLLQAKAKKAVGKSRVHRALRRGESDRALLDRLGLPAEAAARRERLQQLLEPLARLGLPDVPPDPAGVEARAEAVLAGRQVLFGREVETGWPPRWSWRWEGTENAALLAADVRSTWEIQRLQGILPLARGARLAADPGCGARYAEAYVLALFDFHRAHPGPDGLAWESALELGLRLVALVQGLALIAPSAAFAASDVALVKLVDRHARALAADLSLDKVVRGNHLLGELAGLLAAGRLFPEAAPAWWGSVPVAEILEAEILRQFHPDGVSVEQSLTYEKFVLEFLAVAGEASELRGAPFSAPVRERLAAATAHLEAVTAPDGALPRVGDCDSGRGADWGAPDPHRPGGLPARLRRVFGPGTTGGADPPRPSGSPAEASAGGHRGPAASGAGGKRRRSTSPGGGMRRSGPPPGISCSSGAGPSAGESRDRPATATPISSPRCCTWGGAGVDRSGDRGLPGAGAASGWAPGVGGSYRAGLRAAAWALSRGDVPVAGDRGGGRSHHRPGRRRPRNRGRGPVGGSR